MQFPGSRAPEAGSRGSRVSIEFSPGMTSPHPTSPSKSRKRVLSGMRSTGKLHLGNYVGALQNWVRMQDQYECFFFVADWHALTTDYADTSKVKENSLEVLLDWLAAGLDPERCTMFIQSHVPSTPNCTSFFR